MFERLLVLLSRGRARNKKNTLWYLTIPFLLTIEGKSNDGNQVQVLPLKSSALFNLQLP